MGIISKPFQMGYERYRRSVDRIKNNPETNIGEYAAAGATFGAIGGTISGAVAGVATPLYVGWNLTEYLGNKIGLGPFVGTCADIVGSCVFTGVTFEITVPILALAGAGAGAVAGALTLGTIGGCKKGLESLFFKK